MAHGQIHILNDSITVDHEAKGDLDTVDKNIRVLITKLKGAHMNEGGYNYHSTSELETKVHTKVRNHGDGLY